jgi:ABC-2 type transport system permease protein
VSGTAAFTPAGRPAPSAAMLRAQARMELGLLLRNGEQLLLTVAIPTVVLVLFTHVAMTDIAGSRVDFVVPGVLALAVLSTAFTGQAIGTGFERRYGVLRRFASTPMPRLVLVGAKTAATVTIEIGQVVLLCAVGLGLGWSPHGSPLAVIALLLLGTAALSGCGLLLAGTLRAEATLAAANLLFVVLIAVAGIVVPLSEFSPAVRDLLRLLPVTALADGLRVVLEGGRAVPVRDWVVLLVWSAGSIAAAARWFRWD